MRDAEGPGAFPVKSDDIQFVLHPHLHLGHSGTRGNFPKARRRLSCREMDWALAADWSMQVGYIKSDLTKDGITGDGRGRPVRLNGSR